jgi:lipid-binding SYLF domain-containing protein
LYEKVWRIPGSFPTGIDGGLSGHKKETERVENAGKVMKEILNVPDNIPQSLLDKADCVVVLPLVVKAIFGIGTNYGPGVMTCRQGAKFEGHWRAPTMMALEGASFGFQIDGQATDFVLLLMNDRSAKGVLSSKVKLGADASAAAGPKGRDTPWQPTSRCEPKSSTIREPEGRLLEFPLKVPRSVQMELRSRTCMGKRFPQRTL